MRLKIPFKDFTLTDKKRRYILEDQILTVLMDSGESLTIKNGKP
jgi:hypothetical protein